MNNLPATIDHVRGQTRANNTGAACDQYFFWHLVSFDTVKLTITPMNRLTLAMLISILCCYIASAQKVTVGNQSQKVKNETAKGFQVALEGKPEDVAPAWNKFLKDSGKGKSSGELLVITEPTIGGTLYEKGILYARSAGTGEKSTAWVGLLESEWSADELEVVNKELEELVYRFGVMFY